MEQENLSTDVYYQDKIPEDYRRAIETLIEDGMFDDAYRAATLISPDAVQFYGELGLKRGRLADWAQATQFALGMRKEPEKR